MIGHTNICIWSLYLKYLVCLVLWYIYNLVIYCVVFFSIKRKGYSPRGKLVGARHPSWPANAHLVLVGERPNL